MAPGLEDEGFSRLHAACSDYGLVERGIIIICMYDIVAYTSIYFFLLPGISLQTILG